MNEWANGPRRMILVLEGLKQRASDWVSRQLWKWLVAMILCTVSSVAQCFLTPSLRPLWAFGETEESRSIITFSCGLYCLTFSSLPFPLSYPLSESLPLNLGLKELKSTISVFLTKAGPVLRGVAIAVTCIGGQPLDWILFERRRIPILSTLGSGIR